MLLRRVWGLGGGVLVLGAVVLIRVIAAGRKGREEGRGREERGKRGRGGSADESFKGLGCEHTTQKNFINLENLNLINR